MSEISQALDMCEVFCEIPFVPEDGKCAAQEAGKRWKEETRNRLDAGFEVWKRLVTSLNASTEMSYSVDRAELLGKALVALEEGQLRDCILMHACEGTLKNLGKRTSADSIEETFLKLEHARPHMDDIQTMCTILGLCCGYADRSQGYPFALMAYLLWWTGKFHASHDYVTKALERDPSNSLGALLSRVLEVGVLPPWLSRQCGSFHIPSLE